MRLSHIILFLLITTLLSACGKHNPSGELKITAAHVANDCKIVFDSSIYTNEAGNKFIVNEIQYFISNISLQNENGEWIAIDEENNTHYIDTDIEESKTLVFSDIKPGHYTKFSFVFGLNEADNISGRFVNPPESNMFWPEPLGGGYHYMKLNGKWQDEQGMFAPFNTHLGIGQNANMTEFYHNHFTVELSFDLIIKDGETSSATLEMVVDNWYRDPNTIDIAKYSSIMQNQEAQLLFKANGANVFRIKP